MSEQDRRHPESGRPHIEYLQNMVVLFTPCCGARVFFPACKAVPGAALRAICPRDGVDWALDLVADEAVDGGLRPVWSVPEKGAERDR